MRILLPYLVLLVLVFFAACSYARRSPRNRRQVLIGGWAAVAVFALATVYFTAYGRGDPLSAAVGGISATAMLGYAVRGIQRRTRQTEVTEPLGRTRRSRPRAGATR